MTPRENDALVATLDLAGPPHGPLHGLRCAIKDNIDISGVTTSAGNPDWARTHAPPDRHAPVVRRLLEGGARIVCKTVMDELAYGLLGRNLHTGMPPNPAAPSRTTGGSSSGSASVVAGGLVDFALGTDTGGSVRVPASWCGLYGIRPSWGLLPMDGVVPLAPCFDTIGWFARDGRTLARVGQVLSPDQKIPTQIRALFLCDDLFERADPGVRQAILGAVEEKLKPHFALHHGQIGGDLSAWADVFRTLQFGAIWEALGDWLEAVRPRLADDVAARCQQCAHLPGEALQRARAAHGAIQATLHEATRHGVVLCFPTTPSIAPIREFDAQDIEPMRNTLQAFTCLAGLAGAPQVSLPLARVDQAPCGLSLLGAPGTDAALLRVASLICRSYDSGG